MLRAQDVPVRLPLLALVGRQDLVILKQNAVLAAWLLILGAAYYVGAQVGLGFRFANSQIGIVWPPNGLFVAALLLAPRSRWWLILAVTGAVHATVMVGEVAVWRWAWQIAGNSAFALATTVMLQRLANPPLRFDTRRQVLAYLAVAFGMPALFVLITPVFIRSLLGFELTYDPAAAYLRALLSNTAALLIVTPVVLLWAERGVHRVNRLTPRCLIEAALIMASVVGLGLVAFGTGPEFARFPSLLLFLFPPLLWAAARFGPLGATTSIFTVCALSLWGSARELGPFVMLTDGERVLSLQLLWIGLLAPVMLVSAMMREREQAEDALQEQRNHLAHVTRVATAGELSGALAHELRQPLMAILANAQAALQLVQRNRIDRWELRAMLEDIVQENRQAAGVISRLRAFLQEGDCSRASVPVETVVRDALALGRSTIELSSIDVHTQIAPDLTRVRGDHVQLLQVVLNLIVNGCESMAGIGARDRRLRLDVAPADPHHVLLRVADSGVGLPPGGEDRVFDAFFTTKEKGLGLGLAIGRSIAAAHGGRLWAENNPHGGATFHLLLPADRTENGHHQVDRHR